MRKGDTRLKDQCRYMVRRPGEVFFTEKENEPGSPVRAMKDLLLGGTEGDVPAIPRWGDASGSSSSPTRSMATSGTRSRIRSRESGGPGRSCGRSERPGICLGSPRRTCSTCSSARPEPTGHGGGYGDWDKIFYDIANEVRRRAIEGRKEDATQEQLLRAITAIPHRPKKDPREIKILDPACGSGHFLLYCFALLLVI